MKSERTLSVAKKACLMGSLLWGMTAPAQVELDGFAPVLNGRVMSVAAQPDGKVIVGGSFTAVNGVAKSYLARLNSDGSLDNSFALTAAPAQPVSRVLVASSKIYVGAGDGLRRFDASGALDWHYPMNALDVLLQGLPGLPVRLERTSNLVGWQTWTKIVLRDQAIELSEGNASVQSAQFYRALAR